MLKQEPIYGYAIIQRPYFVPISSTSVYMSCYTTINEAAHHYVNGDFLAEKLRIEETEQEVFFGFKISFVCPLFFLVKFHEMSKFIRVLILAGHLSAVQKWGGKTSDYAKSGGQEPKIHGKYK